VLLKFNLRVKNPTAFLSTARRKKYKLKHNNCIERNHQYSRKLERNARGHKSLQGVTALFNLGDVYYSFIDKQRLKYEELWELQQKGRR